MELVNLSIAVGALFFCGLCAHHGMMQYVKVKSPHSRHFMQCGVAFSGGIVVALIEIGILHYGLMTPLLHLIIGSIRNGIMHIIIYHGVVNLSIEMTMASGKIEKKKSMRRQLVMGWICLMAVYIPYRYQMGAFFYDAYHAVRSLIFVWYIFPTVIWYHRRSREAPDFVTHYQMNLLKCANFMGMLHPIAVFVTEVTSCPLSLHFILGLMMTIFFYFGYVTPEWFEQFMYRWFYPLPDSKRLGFFAVIAAAHHPRGNPSLLEAWMRRFGSYLSTPAERLNLLVEAVYLRDMARLPNPEPSVLVPAGAASGVPHLHDTESSAQHPSGCVDFIEEVLEYREVGNLLRYVDERWDGSGPHGLSGQEIPKDARIFALMEAFVGELYISSDEHAALEAIRARAGEFDPELFEALARMIDEDAAS